MYQTLGGWHLGSSFQCASRFIAKKVLAISCVTNMAAGILDQPLSHQEVMETGERVRSSFEGLLRSVLPRIASDVQTAPDTAPKK